MGGVVLAAAGAACFGWGRQARRWAGLPDGAWAVTAVLGLALALEAIGVLSLVGLARPPAFALLVLAGLFLLLRDWRPKEVSEALKRRRPAHAFLLVCAVWLLARHAAPAVFNPGDDLQKYFAHAARLVQTGSLSGGPLNALGSETLGAQAALQGFLAAFLPVEAINAADRVFCLLLCLGMALSAAPAAAVLLLIHPQYVNVSSLYSSAAVLAALVLLDAEDGRAQGRDALGGLLCACALALKPTNLLFIGAYAAFSRPTRSQARLAGWTALFLSPWLLSFAPFYAQALLHPPAPPSLPVPRVREPLSLLSPARVFYGGSMLAYTLLAAGLGVLAWRERGRSRAAWSAGLSAAACYFLVNLAGPSFVEKAGALRYSIPVLLAAAPACAVLFRGRARWSLAALSLLFLPAALERERLISRTGAEPAFLAGWSPEKLEAMLPPDPADLKALQDLVPAGEPVLVWTQAPYQADFKRNRVYDVNESGLGAPWASMPGVKWALWQPEGRWTRSPEGYVGDIARFGRRMGRLLARGYDFRRELDARAKEGEVVAERGGVVLLKLR